MPRSFFISFLTLSIFTPAFAQSHSAPVAENLYANEFVAVLVTPTGDLYGSLVVPVGDSVRSAVLLISGSGPTDRDGNQMFLRNNSIRMIAKELAQRNIATLRYDKRGVAASRAALAKECDVCMEHYVDDVKLWIEYIKRDGRFKNVFIAGHSEGAQIAMAAINEGAKVDGLISIAGAGRSIDQILKEQLDDQPKTIRNRAYVIIDSLKNGHDVVDVPVYLKSLFRQSVQPYIKSMMKYNPQKLIAKINKPILILQGDRDIQITLDDANLLHAANPKSTVEILAGMNHVLKNCVTMMRDEQLATYANPALPINDQITQRIYEFIKKAE